MQEAQLQDTQKWKRKLESKRGTKSNALMFKSCEKYNQDVSLQVILCKCATYIESHYPTDNGYIQ